MNVVFLPGLFETQLSVGFGFPWPSLKVWIDPVTLLGGGITLLQLDASGTLPGPAAGGMHAIVGGPVPQFATPLLTYLTLAGHRVLGLGTDWRMDIIRQGAAAWALIKPWAGGQPICLVSHSMGGLVSRAVYGAMLAEGAQGQLSRIITVGCPQYGSWMPTLAWFRGHSLYRAYRYLSGWRVAPHVGQAWLDAAMATWPSIYQLMPSMLAGPLAQDHPALAALLYELGWYARGNAYMTQALLDQAVQTQAQLLAWGTPSITTCIVGSGYPTISDLTPAGLPAGDHTSFRVEDGDGTVTVRQASPPGATIIPVLQSHPWQILDPSILALIARQLLS